MRHKVTWIVDLDIRSFFDKVRHDGRVQFVEHRIGDNRVVRLIQKWLKAGVVKDGQWFPNEEGSQQGSVISPLLANLYLHYVLDLWAEAWRKKAARGEVIIVRYGDDAGLGVEYREHAERFLEHLRERLRKFGLELHPEKTRLIEFGRSATERRERRGAGKPETFNFLGFTHICGTSHKTGYFTVHRRIIGKRMAAKLKDIRAKLRKLMHGAPRSIGEWLGQVVRGYFHITPFLATGHACGRFAMMCCACGTKRFGDGPSAVASPGSASGKAWGPCCPPSESCNLILPRGSALSIRTSEVGTVCVRSASTGLCEGRSVMVAPTATNLGFSPGPDGG